LWPSNPGTNLPVCTTAGNQSNALIVEDDAYGSIIVWWVNDSEYFDHYGYGIYAQRLRPDGSRMWRQNGFKVANSTDLKEYLRIVKDGLGGAIIAWQQSDDNDTDIYDQRINSQGNPVWTAQVGSYACTVRRRLIDIAGKIVLHSEQTVLKASRACLESLRLPELFNRCHTATVIQ
jgi:hypothetical protein